MDIASKNESEAEKRNEQVMNYESPNISSEWQLSGAMVDSFCPTTWDQPTSSWTPSSNAMLKGGMFLAPAPMMLPQSLAQFPADSGFIERAARFSCFSGGNFSDMMNPFSIPDPYYRGVAPMQAPQEVLKSPSPVSKQHLSDVSLHTEGKEGVRVSGNESDEAECSGRQEEIEGTGEESTIGSKKRKRSGQDIEPDQIADIQKGEQNLNTTSNKPGGKNAKQGSQASDPSKEDYIHVRARRGQATNSHSLAERIRREKISERMKFLQDLVPGCNKVTGKAVMLDEIINYVQSLQRQVEFLSMKLATVNPRLDFNIDRLLAKDLQILQSRAGAGPSSSNVFPPDMTLPYAPLLHPPPPTLLQSNIPGLGVPSDAFRRTLNPHLATSSGGPSDYKDPSSQVPNVWDNELHNIVQMGLNSSIPLSSQDLTGSLPASQMKTEH